MRLWLSPSLLAILFFISSYAVASDVDEFKVKRQEVFDFARKPEVTREGRGFRISFTAKGACDATVAIENSRGRIIRHLASGVLGKNAPPPFKKDSLDQAIVWDGKDDQGVYIDDIENTVVRVSLGLKPRYERSLYWSPHKRYGSMPLLCATKEGVYVYDGKGVDHIRLFDHDGTYIRTVYPFPHKKLKKIRGLDWYDFPQGYRLPRKGGLYQTTLLTSGTNYHTGSHGAARKSAGVTAMDVVGKRIALADVELCRIGTEGDSGGLSLKGPKTGHLVKSVQGGLDVTVGPSSLAFSPDGKTVYMTGYLWQTGSWRRVPGCLHVVYKLDYENGKKMEVFKGDPKKHGQDKDHFRVPTSVATDKKGRVYVTDLINDRIQVYDADGKFLKSIKATKPTKICIHQKTGELWVFSYPVLGVPHNMYKQYKYSPNIKQMLARYSPMPEAKKLSSEPFPLGVGEAIGFEATGHVYHVELDSWTKEPTVWVVGRKHHARGAEFSFSPGYAKSEQDMRFYTGGVRIQRKVGGKWKVLSTFGERAVKKAVRAKPPAHNIQRLYVNPKTGKLYVAEADSGPTIKASNQWLEINPKSGKIKVISLPFNAMEGVFDLNGLLYLRNTDMIVRYAYPAFREVPWDYGEERNKLGNDGGILGKTTEVISGLKLPSTSPVCYHQGGINVSADGDVIASCAYRYVGISSGRKATKKVHQQDVYKPNIYPGRIVSSTSACVHVWDKHGKLKYEDAVPGAAQLDGVAIDRDDNIYVMHTPTRSLDGKPYFNHMSETLMKVKPKKAKVITSSKRAPVPVPKGSPPKPKQDLEGFWVKNAEWFYGGVGFAGFNMKGHGGGCACWFSRFALDYFARSIAPEPYQFRVAVVDSAGNLVLRIGRCGNVDDGKPLVAETAPPNARSIGGDEVALFHACFVGTHTDRRIFISDHGNGRIVSVKLDYHKEEKISLAKLAGGK